MRRLATLLLLVLVSTGPAFAGTRTVYAVNLGWHTGIAVDRLDLSWRTLPEFVDFPTAAWLEIGWGDEQFYRTPDPDIGILFSAAITPTPAVLHVVGLPVDPEQYFRRSEVLAVPLEEAEFDRLISFIYGSFRRTDAERATAVGDGLHANSKFYPALGEFHLLNTCNTWVAEAFAYAGLAVDPKEVIRASTVMERLRRAVGLRTGIGG